MAHCFFQEQDLLKSLAQDPPNAGHSLPSGEGVNTLLAHKHTGYEKL